MLTYEQVERLVVFFVAAYAPPIVNHRVETVIAMERLANPHNEPDKPKRRSYEEIALELKIKDAVQLLRATQRAL